MNDTRFDEIRKAGGELYASFLEDGYREFFNTNGLRRTNFMIQKRILDKGKTLFFINVWVYDFTEFDPKRVVFSPEAQFTLGDITFNVTMIAQELTPRKVLDFFTAIFDKMGCEPYG